MSTDISKFITSPEHEALVITHSSIFQIEVAVIDKFSEEYKERSAIAVMDSEDMKNMGVKEGDAIIAHNENGSVVVAVDKSSESHKGMIFMPDSFYSNILMSPDADSIGMPDCKRVKANISKTDKSVASVKDLLEEIARIRV